MVPIFSFAYVLHLCLCFFVSLHDVMVWYWPFSTFHPQNVDPHIIWLDVFVSVLSLPHGAMHLHLTQKKQLLKKNGCLHFKGLHIKEVIWKIALLIRKVFPNNILEN